MTFDNPHGLWFLALGLPILAFHFYRGRSRRLSVPTLLFWEQVLVEEERRTALGQLRHHVSLLLNLLALLVLASAVSGPGVEGITRKPGRYALLLDDTASMGALEPDGRTRMEHAIGLARTFLQTLGRGDEASVLALSGPREPFTADMEGLCRRLSPPPLGRATDVGEIVHSVSAAGTEVAAILFTDRPPAGVEDLLATGRLRVVRVGSPRNNVGWIGGVPVRRAGEKRMTISLTVRNYSASPAARSVGVMFLGVELERQALELGPGERRELNWILDPARYAGQRIEEGGPLEIRLEPPDDLPFDDATAFVLPPLVPPRVIVFHPGKPDEFLMRALHALHARGIAGRPLEASVARFSALRDRMGEGDVVVFDRATPQAPLGLGAYLLFGAGKGTFVERPTLAYWDREAPPNRLVDYSGVSLAGSRILEGPPLIMAVEGPVAAWRSRGGQAVVEFGFALEEALQPMDFRQSAAFPMVLFNFVEWGAFLGIRSFRTEYAAGEPLRPERPLWVDEGELVVEGPVGAEHIPVRNGRAGRMPSAAPGFTRVSAAGRSEWIAANVFDPAESDLQGPEGASPERDLPSPAPWHSRIPYAVPAAAAALLLLLLEWWLFHRGSI